MVCPHERALYTTGTLSDLIDFDETVYKVAKHFIEYRSSSMNWIPFYTLRIPVENVKSDPIHHTQYSSVGTQAREHAVAKRNESLLESHRPNEKLKWQLISNLYKVKNSLAFIGSESDALKHMSRRSKSTQPTQQI